MGSDSNSPHCNGIKSNQAWVCVTLASLTITCHINAWQVTFHLLAKPSLSKSLAPVQTCVVLVGLNFMQSTCCWGAKYLSIFIFIIFILIYYHVSDLLTFPALSLVNVTVSWPLIGPRRSAGCYQVLDLCRVTSRCNLYWSPREQECPDIPRHRHWGCDQALYTLTWSPAHDDDEPGQPPGWWLVMSRDI